MVHYVCIPSMGELPDVFVELIQQIPAAKIVPVHGSLAQQVQQVREFVDKHEIRRHIVFIARGTGAFVAQIFAGENPQRVESIIGWGYPEKLLRFPAFFFREKRLIPRNVPVIRVDSLVQVCGVLQERR